MGAFAGDAAGARLEPPMDIPCRRSSGFVY